MFFFFSPFFEARPTNDTQFDAVAADLRSLRAMLHGQCRFDADDPQPGAVAWRSGQRRLRQSRRSRHRQATLGFSRRSRHATALFAVPGIDRGGSSQSLAERRGEVTAVVTAASRSARRSRQRSERQLAAPWGCRVTVNTSGSTRRSSAAGGQGRLAHDRRLLRSKLQRFGLAMEECW
jgi:hypothetical protein